jgi:hypothetical protein
LTFHGILLLNFIGFENIPKFRFGRLYPASFPRSLSSRKGGAGIGLSHPSRKETIHPVIFGTGNHLRVGLKISSGINQRMIRTGGKRTQIFELEVWMAFQKRSHDPIVLFAGHRAGTVHQNSPAFQPGRNIIQEPTLKTLEAEDIFGLPPPLGLRIAVKDAQAGAGRIHKDPVKQIIGRKGEGPGRVRLRSPHDGDSQTGTVFLDEPKF